MYTDRDRWTDILVDREHYTDGSTVKCPSLFERLRRKSLGKTSLMLHYKLSKVLCKQRITQ